MINPAIPPPPAQPYRIPPEPPRKKEHDMRFFGREKQKEKDTKTYFDPRHPNPTPPSSYSPPFPKPKQDQDAEMGNMISSNMRGKALIAAIETGLVKENEDGSVNTAVFNKFWDEIEKILYESWKEKGGQGFNKLFRTSEPGK